MVRKGRARRLKLEAFGRAHLKGWGYSNLNQREYCERHGLPLKRFGNWRAEFKNEQTIVPEGLLWRRGGGDCTGASNKTREILPPPLRRRRNYSDADKNRLAFPSCLIGRATVRGPKTTATSGSASSLTRRQRQSSWQKAGLEKFNKLGQRTARLQVFNGLSNGDSR